MEYCVQSASGGVEVGAGGVDGGVELGVDEEREAGAGDVGEGADEVLFVDGGEAVAAGIDEEALEAGDTGEGERLEVALIAVDAAAPEGVVDHALRGVVGAAGGCGFALEFEGGDVGGLGETVERHVDEGGEAAGGGGAGGGGEAFPLGAAGLVDVGVDVDEAGQEGERAEVFGGEVRDARGEMRSLVDCGDDAVFDDYRGILFAMGRDDATGAESVYHDAD